MDIPGIDGVIQYGICTEIPEMVQRLGRGGCGEPVREAFFVMMIEPWVLDLDVDSLDEKLELDDPDRPFATSDKKTPTKRECVGIAAVRLVHSPVCLREQLADNLQDDSPNGMYISLFR